ncbi:hypothetical protein Hs30E_13380 [Lactococcus hodotermopsidis]|uniref:Uncharacterized protein n=1 Tax=Pseudolactococcus hodotermopsidis TaxID=2709157 RepID=A0A6A0BG17_9LACT|nr:DUF2129 domain-containing protein [Lactococcus hodotermopsidis]GFH42787.1 hypothetical protein Hs30E_13380 [Lactococcus hodotermopsidis]
MADMLENLNKVKVQPLEIVGRTAVYVFYSSYKHVRQLTRFGDMLYSSKKARYALLYVDTADLDTIVPSLEKLHFVKEVKVSALDSLDRNFSAAFLETTQALKNEETAEF